MGTVLRNKDRELQDYAKRKQKKLSDPDYLARCQEVDKIWYQKNKERIRSAKNKRIAERKITDPNYAKKCAEANAKYHQEHRDEIRERKQKYMQERLIKNPDLHKTYHQNSKDKRNEYSREYMRTEKGKESRKKSVIKNPFYVREKSQRRRARKRTTQVEPISNLIIFKRDELVCQICKRSVDINLSYPHPFSPSLDHIIPLAKGGTHTMDNIQLAHLTCNVKKHAKLEAA